MHKKEQCRDLIKFERRKKCPEKMVKDHQAAVETVL
jgi:hypothetical protein